MPIATVKQLCKPSPLVNSDSLVEQVAQLEIFGELAKAGNEFFKRNPFTADRRCDMTASCARKRAELTAPTWRAQANEGAAP